jgi:hypothetical protein
MLYVDLVAGLRLASKLILNRIISDLSTVQKVFTWSFLGLKVFMIYPMIIYMRFWLHDTSENRASMKSVYIVTVIISIVTLIALFVAHEEQSKFLEFNSTTTTTKKRNVIVDFYQFQIIW